MQSVTEWAQLNFGRCQLKDKRRTNRLMQVAEQVASNPSASLPDQIERWGDLKAAYRLFDHEEVTFEAIARPHWERTKQSARGRCLVISDTTEIDFGKDRQIEGVGETAKAAALFERLLSVRNDVGLLAEEYDPIAKRQLGNFPQAMTHVSLINTAYNLTPASPAAHRAKG